jgi:hypothetical protein
MNNDVTLNGVGADLAAEEVPTLADFAEETGGAWPKGWYSAEIIEGYSTRKGTVFTTEDNPSKDGNSRNLRLCFKVHKGTDERTIQESFNYRVTDLTPERLKHIKELREEFKGVKGRWPDADGQRSSLAVAKLGMLERALGFTLKRATNGQLVPGVFIGQKLDVYLGVDDNGYNEVRQAAAFGTRTGHGQKA